MKPNTDPPTGTKLNKSDWAFTGFFVFSTLLIVFCIIQIVDIKSSIRVTNLGIDSIAPENLKRAPELFRLSLKVESQEFPVEEMMKTKSWEKLQSSISGYAERLELIENHNRKRSIMMSFATLFAAIGMPVFVLLSVNFNPKRWLQIKMRHQEGKEN